MPEITFVAQLDIDDLPINIFDSQCNIVYDELVRKWNSNSIDLNPGYYLAQLTLPSGEILKEKFFVESRQSSLKVHFSLPKNSQSGLESKFGQAGNLVNMTYPQMLEKKNAKPIEFFVKLWSLENNVYKEKKLRMCRTIIEEIGFFLLEIRTEFDFPQLIQIGGPEYYWRFTVVTEERFFLAICYDNHSHGEGLFVRIISKNEDLARFNSYINNNKMAEAYKLAKKLGRGKYRDYNAAVFACYFLLNNKRLDDIPEHWLNNLRNIEKSPDGAIIYAWNKWYRQNSLDFAEGIFSQTTNRGLPFFQDGLKLLINGLRRFAYIDEKRNHKKLEQFLPYWSSLDWQNPYTTFYGKSPEKNRLGKRHVGINENEYSFIFKNPK